MRCDWERYFGAWLPKLRHRPQGGITWRLSELEVICSSDFRHAFRNSHLDIFETTLPAILPATSAVVLPFHSARFLLSHSDSGCAPRRTSHVSSPSFGLRLTFSLSACRPLRQTIQRHRTRSRPDLVPPASSMALLTNHQDQS